MMANSKWRQVSCRLDEHLWWVVDPYLDPFLPQPPTLSLNHSFTRDLRKQHWSSVSLNLYRWIQHHSESGCLHHFCETTAFRTKWPEWGQRTNPQLKRIQSPGGTNHFSFQCIPGLLEMKCMTSDLLPLLYWIVCIHLNTINTNYNLQTDWRGRKRRKPENVICRLIHHSRTGHPHTGLFFFFKKFLFSDELSFDKVLKIVWSNVSMEQTGNKRFPCRSELSRIRCKLSLAVSCGNVRWESQGMWRE